MTDYEKHIARAFQDVCEKNKDDAQPGASPAEVTALLAERGQLSSLDTVIDIERLMKELRHTGALYKKVES